MNYNYDNQYNTSYGAAGAADGGGFVAGEPQSSQAGGGKAGYGKDTVRPMTIKQMLDAQQPHSDADFKSDGEPFSQVTFVGQIRSISTQPTNITYKIDDGTGLIEVKQWPDVDLRDQPSDQTMELDMPQKAKLVEEGYCRVWGRLKAFNNKRHVGAHIIRPVTDYNEVNYHLLEATAMHLFFAKGGLPNKDAGANGQPKAAGETGTRNEYASASDSQLSHVSSLARRVFSTLKSLPQSNEGLHVQMIASAMGIATNDVFKGAEELVVAGVIFTTVDESTWAVLDG